MKILEPGHKYELENIDGEGSQILEFVRRIPESQAQEGILMQEVLRALIDRTNFLNEQVPAHENITILIHLRASLLLLETRATRRRLERIVYPEREPVCSECGHVHLSCGGKI